jgi:hypothetical protein
MGATDMILRVHTGVEAGHEFRLKRGLLAIGRAADNDWVTREPSASRHHAELRRFGDQWLVVDLGSTNGTHLQGQRLEPHVARPLAPGSPVAIGDTTFVLEGEPAQQVEPAIPPAPPAAEPGLGTLAGLWICRLLVGLGALLLIVGTLGTWVQVQVDLPLLGTVFDRTYGGMDTEYGWLFMVAAGAVLLFVVLDLVLRRWGLAWGMAQAILGVAAAGVSAYSVYRYYKLGQQQILGISLIDVLNQYARNTVRFSVETGVYLVGAGIAAIVVGGLLRLLIAGFEPG